MSDRAPTLPAVDDELTDEERAMLDFLSLWWKNPGAREREIRERFEVSPTRYFQRVLQLVERPAAIAYAPLTCKRYQQRRAG